MFQAIPFTVHHILSAFIHIKLLFGALFFPFIYFLCNHAAAIFYFCLHDKAFIDTALHYHTYLTNRPIGKMGPAPRCGLCHAK
jgi:hypothetical protein